MSVARGWQRSWAGRSRSTGWSLGSWKRLPKRQGSMPHMWGPGALLSTVHMVHSLGLTLLQLARWALRPDTLE